MSVKAKSTKHDLAIVAKAALRCADLLGLSDQDLASALGVSGTVVETLRRGFDLDADTDLLAAATLFVRASRLLMQIAHDSQDVAREWLRAHNTALGARPIEILKTERGLASVFSYLHERTERSGSDPSAYPGP